MLSGIKFGGSAGGAAASVAPASTSASASAASSSHREHRESSHSHKHHKKSSKSKKDKKHSKDKKHKEKQHGKHSSKDEKHAKKRRLDEKGTAAHSDSSSDSSSDEDDERRERTVTPVALAPAPAPTPAPVSTLVRDSWMNPVVLSPEEKERERLKQLAAAEAQAIEQRRIEAEEAERKRVASEGGLMGRHRIDASAPAPTAVTVGDGGASWRAKALKRARERAAEEGISVKAAITERLGNPEPQRSNNNTGRSNGPADAGFPSSFGKQPTRHHREDESTLMEIVETEEEMEARAAKAASAARKPVDLSRLMKRPTEMLAPSPPAATAAAPASSAWRDKLKKTLTGTAAPGTPEGDVARLYSTPSAVSMSRLAPTPSPLPSPSPSPSPYGQDAQRFAGMDLRPSSLGMDQALNVVMEERTPSSSPQAEGEHALPQFAAAFMPVGSPSPAAPAVPAASVPFVPVGASAADLNKLSAQAQVAKLKKNTKLYDDLQRQIAHIKAAQVQTDAVQQVTHNASSAQHARLHQHGGGSGLPRELSIDDKLHLLRSEGGASSASSRTAHGHEVVVLSHDPHGRPLPGAAASSGPQRDPSMRNKRLAPNINEAGERVAYFADDVKETSLKDLVAKEKLARQAASLGLSSSHHDIDRDYAQSIARDANFKLGGTDEQFDDADFSMGKFDRSTSLANQKRSTQEQETRKRSQQIQQHHRHDNTIERCWYCLQGSKDIVKSLILSIGVRCYLAIPRTNWITPGHCTIMPIDHTLAQTHMEDDVYEEVNYFKKHLEKMYAAAQPPMKCVFLETVYDLAKNRHTVIECVPLSQDQYQDAEMYFVKAIDEADEEWATNKKLIRFTSEKGGVRQAVPKNFNYFSVEFGTSDGGFAHPIEDSNSFPIDFGKAIILDGLLGESAQLLLRNKRAGAAEESKRVKEFMPAWRRFDWTQKLAGGSRAPAPAAATAAAAATGAR